MDIFYPTGGCFGWSVCGQQIAQEISLLESNGKLDALRCCLTKIGTQPFSFSPSNEVSCVACCLNWPKINKKQPIAGTNVPNLTPPLVSFMLFRYQSSSTFTAPGDSLCERTRIAKQVTAIKMKNILTSYCWRIKTTVTCSTVTFSINN